MLDLDRQEAARLAPPLLPELAAALLPTAELASVHGEHAPAAFYASDAPRLPETASAYKIIYIYIFICIYIYIYIYTSTYICMYMYIYV